jgi:3-dehydro-L-gulonate 2-dehydrogenase
MVKVPAPEVRSVLESILLSRSCPADRAAVVAAEVTRNSLEGTYSHGVNRFPRLVRNIDQGLVVPAADPAPLNAFGALENWDGASGLGIVNALRCMDRAIELAESHGIGCVALRNTNHWLRAATYGYRACERGMAGICFTNTIPNMPTWGASDAKLGNNPLVLAFPYRDGDIVVDMAMSQFSYGALETAVLAGERMPVPAGFDAAGNLTDDPAAVCASKRVMPTGYWKGAALSFALDIFAGALSLGNTVAGIGRLPGEEHGMSQTFIAVNFARIAPPDQAEAIVRNAVEDLLASRPDGSGGPIVYPGQRMRATRDRNLAEGIPLDERVWAEVLSLV